MGTIWDQINAGKYDDDIHFIKALSVPALRADIAVKLDQQREASKQDTLFSGCVGLTPLQMAAVNGEVNLFKHLAGLINKLDSNSDSFNENLKQVYALLSASYQFNPYEGFQAAHFAIYGGFHEIVKCIVDIDAVLQKHLNSTESLLQIEASDMGECGLLGFTLAFRVDDFKILNLLVNANNINQPMNTQGETPLVYCIQYGLSIEIIDWLLRQDGMDVNTWSSGWGMETNALCAAVVAEREDVVDRLLSTPSLCINNIMGLYENCGHIAVRNNQHGILKKLLNYQLKDTQMQLKVNGYSVSDYRKPGHEKLAAYHEAKPLLVLAVEEDKPKMVEVLLQCSRVDVNVDNGSALKIALQKGFIEIAVQLIQDKRTEVNCFLPERTTWLDLKLALLGRESAKQEKTYLTPLHAAVKDGNLKIIKALLERSDVEVNVPAVSFLKQDRDGVLKGLKTDWGTELHTAASNRDPNIARNMYHLLSRDPRVDPSLKDENGQTPMGQLKNRGDYPLASFDGVGLPAPSKGPS